MIIMCQFFFGKQEILNQTDPHTFDCKFIKRITSCLFVYSSLLFTAREQAYLYIISVPFLVSLFVNAFLFYSFLAAFSIFLSSPSLPRDLGQRKQKITLTFTSLNCLASSCPHKLLSGLSAFDTFSFFLYLDVY